MLRAPIVAATVRVELTVTTRSTLPKAKVGMNSDLGEAPADRAVHLDHRTEDSEALPEDSSSVDRLRDRTIVLDCRWLGLGGAGRVTELLLREFQDSRPAG